MLSALFTAVTVFKNRIYRLFPLNFNYMYREVILFGDYAMRYLDVQWRDWQLNADAIIPFYYLGNRYSI